MKKLLQLGLLLALAAPVCYGQIQGLGQSKITANGPCLDKDGDGYGVGAGCLGPDADDNDPSVHSYSDIQAKYGPDPGYGNVSRPVNNWLAHTGYFDATNTWTPYQVESISGNAPSQSIASQNRVWVIDTTNGNDSTGEVSTTSADDADTTYTSGHTTGAPFATFNLTDIFDNIEAGDVILVRAGTYSVGVLSIPCKGTAGHPVILAAWPGEQPVIDGSFDGSGCSYLIIDGFKLNAPSGSACPLTIGNALSGVAYVNVDNIAVRHNDLAESVCGGGGNLEGNNFHNLIVEENVSHDPGAYNHAIYLGANTAASDGVIIRRNVAYNQLTGQTGGSGQNLPALQFNGRCNWDNTGIPCQITQNLIYSANSGAITVAEGFAHSFITSNQIINGGRITLLLYAGSCNEVNYNSDGGGFGPDGTTGSICPYDENYNVIANNTVYANYQDPLGYQICTGAGGSSISGFCQAVVISNDIANTNELLNGDDPITALSVSGTTVSLTFTLPEEGSTNIQSGQSIVVSGVSPSTWNGTFTIASMSTVSPTSTTATITYTQAISGSPSSLADAAVFGPNSACAPSGSESTFPCGDLGHNTYLNNILIGGDGASEYYSYSPVFYECPNCGASWNLLTDNSITTAEEDTWKDNVLYSFANSQGTAVVGVTAGGGATYTCSTAPFTSNTGCLNTDPGFVAASQANYASPQLYSLYPGSGSSALNAGSSWSSGYNDWKGVLSLDGYGKPFWSSPSLGAIERLGYQQGWTDIAGTAWSNANDTYYSNNTLTLFSPQRGQGNANNAGIFYDFVGNITDGPVHSWSSGTGSSSGLYVYGGGHSDWYGNELHLLNLGVQPAALEMATRPSPVTLTYMYYQLPYDSLEDPWIEDTAQTNTVKSTQCQSLTGVGGLQVHTAGSGYSDTDENMTLGGGGGSGAELYLGLDPPTGYPLASGVPFAIGVQGGSNAGSGYSDTDNVSVAGGSGSGLTVNITVGCPDSTSTVGQSVAKAAVHTYGGEEYFPPSFDNAYPDGGMFVIGGGVPGGGSHFDDTWLFNLNISGSIAQETEMDPESGFSPFAGGEPPGTAITSLGSENNLAMYDSFNNTMWVIWNTILLQYSATTNTYTKECSSSCGPYTDGAIPEAGYGDIQPGSGSVSSRIFVIGSDSHLGDSGHLGCIYTGSTPLSIADGGCGTGATQYVTTDILSQTTGCGYGANAWTATMTQSVAPWTNSTTPPPAGAGTTTSYPGMTWDSYLGVFVSTNTWPVWPGYGAYQYVGVGYEFIDNQATPHLWKVTTAGTTGTSTPPNWSSGGTITDGSAQETDQGIAPGPPVYTFDPSTLTCTAYSYSGGPIAVTGDSVGLFGRLRYVSSIGAEAIIADTTVDSDVLCLRSSGCDISFPSPPSSLGGSSISGGASITGGVTIQ